MHSFRSEDSCLIKDRGREYMIDAGQIPEGMYDPCALKGETVLIDGQVFEVLGVDTFAIARSPENPYGFGFGLLTRGHMKTRTAYVQIR